MIMLTYLSSEHCDPITSRGKPDRVEHNQTSEVTK